MMSAVFHLEFTGRPLGTSPLLFVDQSIENANMGHVVDTIGVVADAS